jgi:hypothetical protein
MRFQSVGGGKNESDILRLRAIRIPKFTRISLILARPSPDASRFPTQLATKARHLDQLN